MFGFPIAKQRISIYREMKSRGKLESIFTDKTIVRQTEKEGDMV